MMYMMLIMLITFLYPIHFKLLSGINKETKYLWFIFWSNIPLTMQVNLYLELLNSPELYPEIWSHFELPKDSLYLLMLP